MAQPQLYVGRAYSDVDAVIGEDEGRVGRCEFVLRHCDWWSSVVEDVIEQVSVLIRDSHIGSAHYPSDELEWLTVTLFNRAVDFYCAGQEKSSRKWADMAIQLSSLCA